MILELSIENFILIKKQIIPFSEGFNVITGETGAGKSMILGAIELVFGAKADKSLIKIGESEARISCTMDIRDCEAARLLMAELGMDVEDNLIVISRSIKAEGKSLIRINGRIVPVGLLRSLKESLIEITSQNDQYELLSPMKQLLIVDDYGGIKVERAKEAVSDIYKDLVKVEKKLSEMDISESEVVKKLDFFKFQIDEIESAAFYMGEDEELEEKILLINNAIEIGERRDNLHSLMEGTSGALSHLQKSLRELERLKSMVSGLENLYGELQGFYYDVEANYESIKSILRDARDEDLNSVEVEKRLNIINDIKRKYGKNYEAVWESLGKIKSEYEYYSSVESKREDLKSEYKKLMEKYKDESKKLREIRTEYARELAVKITSALKELNIISTIFEISVSETEKISAMGSDRIEFLARLNLGQEIKPIEKAASGGELSRIMLAVKSIVGDMRSTPVIVFDEIDTGISGVTATAVARKIKDISKYSQIIAITHLPQIAAFGEGHLLVEKHEDKLTNTTTVSVKLLEDEERTVEITRIISGGLSGDMALESAKQMLSIARS